MRKRPSAVKRHQDWPTRLHVFLQAQAHRPFSYGDNDCCLFVADAVLAMTGVDFAEGIFRGQYKTKARAYSLLKKFGGGGVVEMMQEWTKRGYFKEISPSYAGRGDIVSLQIGGSESLGLVDLSGYHIAAVGPEGLTRLPITLAKRGWTLCQQ